MIIIVITIILTYMRTQFISQSCLQILFLPSLDGAAAEPMSMKYQTVNTHLE